MEHTMGTPNPVVANKSLEPEAKVRITLNPARNTMSCVPRFHPVYSLDGVPSVAGTSSDGAVLINLQGPVKHVIRLKELNS